MTSERGRLTDFWRRIKVRSGEQGERHATWLELFYDLVFVVAIAELGHNLSTDYTAVGLLQFLGLFVPIWWAWFHHTIYADRFETDDAGHRLLTILQMVSVAALAATVHGAIGDTAQEFALAIVGVRVVQIVMYLRTWHMEAARPLCRRLIGMFAIGSIAWIVSISLPEPWRYILWAAILVSEFGFVYLPATRRTYAKLPLSESHLPERFGLFTIIVLGESVAGVVAGLAEQDLRSMATVLAASGILVAFGIWWVYFANLEGGVLKGLGGWSVVVWVYSHLPLMMGLTALGVGIDHAVAEDPGHALDPFGVWLVAGSLAAASLAIAVNRLATAKVVETVGTRRRVGWRVGVAAVALAVGGVVVVTDGIGLLLLAPLAVLSLLQVATDLFGWE